MNDEELRRALQEALDSRHGPLRQHDVRFVEVYEAILPIIVADREQYAKRKAAEAVLRYRYPGITADEMRRSLPGESGDDTPPETVTP